MALSSTGMLCLFCQSESDEDLNVVKAGLDTLIKASQTADTDIYARIINLQESGRAIKVHNSCRRKYTRKRKIEEPSTVTSKRTRSSLDCFDWKSNCFLCTKYCNIRNFARDKIRQVRTLELRNTFMQYARQRNDKWGNEVLGLLESCIDLVAVEAIYHLSCSTKFRYSSYKTTKGRPVAECKVEAYEKFCEWFKQELESNCEIYTIHELYSKMLEQASGEVYCVKTFRDKIKKCFNNQLYFRPGCDSVVFRNINLCILKNMKTQSKDSVIAAAAKLIKEDIRRIEISPDFYPNDCEIWNEEEGSKWVPESLQSFMSPRLLKD